MYAQCDTEGNQYLLLKEIVDWKKDYSTTDPADMYVTHGSNRHFRKTTKGWHLCVEWKDGTTSWERLADLKESNPIEVAEFAVAHGLQDQPAFIWWVLYTLKQCNQIIAVANKHSLKRMHKFGIEVPCSYNDCVCLN